MRSSIFSCRDSRLLVPEPDSSALKLLWNDHWNTLLCNLPFNKLELYLFSWYIVVRSKSHGLFHFSGSYNSWESIISRILFSMFYVLLNAFCRVFILYGFACFATFLCVLACFDPKGKLKILFFKARGCIFRPFQKKIYSFEYILRSN